MCLFLLEIINLGSHSFLFEKDVDHFFLLRQFSTCPPVRQVWVLYRIPSNPIFFPIGSLFINMDHLFWRVNPNGRSSLCVDIMVHLEGRNNKVFINLDVDPRETLQLAEVESTLWAEAHVINDHRLTRDVQVRPDLGTT